MARYSLPLLCLTVQHACHATAFRLRTYLPACLRRRYKRSITRTAVRLRAAACVPGRATIPHYLYRS